MNPVLAEILETKQVTSVDGSITKKLHSNIDVSEGEFLQHLVRQVNPSLTLEIGLAFGISALFICDALPKSARQHIAIDPFQFRSGPWGSWDGIGMENLNRAGYSHLVRLIEEPSYRALVDFERSGQTVDFVFVDGQHLFDFVMVDFFLVDRILRPGGIVAFDDSNWPSVRKALRFIRTNRAYTVVHRPTPVQKPGLKRRVAEQVARVLPVRRFTRPEILTPDRSVGLEGSCVAFRKDAEDSRFWDHYADF